MGEMGDVSRAGTAIGGLDVGLHCGERGCPSCFSVALIEQSSIRI